MNVSHLEDAQQEVVTAIDGGVRRFSTPVDGSWPADLVVAHVILTTELLVRTTEHVLIGRATWWDNAPASMRANLQEVVRGGGGICALLDRYWFAAEALTHVAAKLTVAHAATPIAVRVISGAVVEIDQVPLPWGRALQWHAEQHLPEHVAQLKQLLAR